MPQIKHPAKWIWKPHPGPQTFALAVDGINELLFGGSRGPGKTDAGIMWLVEPPYINHKRYRALVIRRNAEDLSDWRDRAMRWWRNGGLMPSLTGKPGEIKFPSGAIIRLGHLKDKEAYSKYLGHEYHKMLIEELTQIVDENHYVQLIGSCRSTVPELEARVFATTNPGGVGHQWVKARWGIGKDAPNVACTKPDGRLRLYIPATVQDNPTLMINDPSYVEYLKTLPEPLRSAWYLGDWDVFMGQMFNITASHIEHVGEIPESAPIFFGFDYGFGAPYACTWAWIDYDNRCHIFDELYGAVRDRPNVGLRQTDEEIAELIMQKEIEIGIRGRNITRLCDPTCFNKKPDYRGGGQGASTAEVFAQMGLPMNPGDPSRILKIRQFHQRLRLYPDRQPMMVFGSNCEHCLRTIPTLQSSDRNPEDIPVTGQEDHCLVGETLVDTDKGQIPIRDLVGTSGKVVTVGGYWADYHSCRETRENVQTVQVELEDGRTVRCTPDHNFLTPSGWVEANRLASDAKCYIFSKNEKHLLEDLICKLKLSTQQHSHSMAEDTGSLRDARGKALVQILAQGSSHGKLVGVKRVSPMPKADVYCMVVDETHAFSVNGGLIVSNCYDSVCNILMALRPSAGQKKGKKTRKSQGVQQENWFK